MPICHSPKCLRQDLPVAAMFPPIAKIVPAHVRPDGEPCTELPGTYADDVHEMIMDEDALWDLDGTNKPGPAVDGTSEAATVRGAVPRAAEAPVSLGGSNPSPGATPPAKPAKPARKRAAKRAPPPHAPAPESDVDEWDP